MIGEFLTSTLGGFWPMREQMLKSKSRIIKLILLKIYFQYMKENGSMIQPEATFANKPTFPHGPTGIFISKGAKIGENSVIFQHVTIGSNTIPTSKTKGAPTIGNNVYIGAGAAIIGGITVGNNCRIGANCIVAQNIPDHSVVVMEKPRIIRKENIDNTQYYSFSRFSSEEST